MRFGRLWCWFSALVGCTLARSAGAAPNDRAALRQISETMTGHGAGRHDQAEAALLGTDRACADQCSAGVRARIWLYIGSVRGTGSHDQEGARFAFERALKLDSSLAPDPACTNDETKATYWIVRAEIGLGSEAQSIGPDLPMQEEQPAAAAGPPYRQPSLLLPQPPTPAAPGRAEQEPSAVHHSGGFLLGAYATGFVPIGDWRKNAISKQTMFGPGAGGTVEIGGKVQRFTLTAQFAITSLYVGGWERYAAEHGSSISAHARQLDILAVASVDLWRWDSVRLELRAGIGYMRAFGTEHNRDYGLTYDYEFLKPSIAACAGLAGAFRLWRSGELVVLTDQLAGWPGAEYADQRRAYLGVSLSAGIRFWPVP